MMVLFVAALAAGAVACHKPKDPENPPQVKAKLDKVAKLVLWKVDASDDQKRRVDMIMTGLSVDMFAVQQDNNRLTLRIMNALDATKVDDAALEAVAQDGAALVGRQLRQMFRAVVEIAGVLTDEQRHKAVKMWREWEFGS